MYKSYQLSIITDGGIVTTRHYGVDGDPAEITAELWEDTESVENKDGLREAFAAFTKGYDPEMPDAGKVNLFTRAIDGTDEIAFDHEGEWYADFVIVRNLTDKDFNISALRGKYDEICLYNGEGVVLNLGGFYAGSDADVTRRKLLAELEDLKENLWDNDASKNYSLVWNLCSDYDNDQQDDLYLTDIITEAEFVDEYLLEDYFQNVLAKDPSLARIRNFIGDTDEDAIYKFDGYGNLANVDKDDFIDVIDRVQEKVIGAIEPEKPYRPQSKLGKSHAHTDGACM
jgi:hypothetical protein